MGPDSGGWEDDEKRKPCPLTEGKGGTPPPGLFLPLGPAGALFCLSLIRDDLLLPPPLLLLLVTLLSAGLFPLSCPGEITLQTFLH